MKFTHAARLTVYGEPRIRRQLCRKDVMNALDTAPKRSTSSLPDQPEQCRELLTDLPRPLSRALQTRRDEALPAGLSSTMPVFVHSRPDATSVGAAASDWFTRPVTFQGTTDVALPPALQAGSPWAVTRRVNGRPSPVGHNDGDLPQTQTAGS